MMAIATDRSPPFDQIVVPSYPKFGRHQMEAMDCPQRLRENELLLRSPKDSIPDQ